MRMCMREDAFADTSFGKLALKKMPNRDPNFRLYEAGWLTNGGDVMFVTGAIFREAKSGSNKGKMTVMIPGTKRTVHVTADEIKRFDERK